MSKNRRGNEKLREARIAHKWSQDKLAELMDTSKVTISRWENGISFPTPYFRKKLCDVFQMNEEELGLTRSGDEDPSIEVAISVPAKIISPSPDTTVPKDLIENAENADTIAPLIIPHQDLLAVDIATPDKAVPRNVERERMLQYVHSIWIKGVLDKSIQDDSSIVMHMHELPEAITSPLESSLQKIYRAGHQPLTTTSITEAYDNAHEKLLILGEPGSGKTTLLLELARILLERARIDEAHAIPIIFNLSSWHKKQQAITKWLVEELNTKYHVSTTLGQSWIKAGELLPLLDGLDEVPISLRSACVEAINDYLQDHGLVPMVICSRQADYLKLSKRILMHSAVVVQRLTEQQVTDYLQKKGKQAEILHKIFLENPPLRTLATTPLMLVMLAATNKRDHLSEDLQEKDALTIQHNTFATYVTYRLSQKTDTRYTQTQTIKSLIWLAQQLKKHSENDFFIEFMQIDWLPAYRLRSLYPGFAVGIIYGLLSGIGYGVSYVPYFPFSQVIFFMLSIALFNTLVYGLLNGFLFGLLSDILASWQHTSPQRQQATEIAQKILKVLSSRVIYGIINGLLNGVFVGLLVSSISGWICGLFSCAFCAALGKQDKEIRCTDYLSWSWSSMFRNAYKFFAGGLLLGLCYGLVTGRMYLFTFDKLFPSLILGLGIGLLVSMIMSIRGGFTNKVPRTTYKSLKPNQGMRNSLRYSLFFAVFFGVAFGLLFGLIYGPGLFMILGQEYKSSFPPDSGLIYGLSDGFIVASFFWLLSGGIACIQHFFLRFLLWRAGSIPWNYPDFLDYAVELTFLYKIGGGYIFYHGLLQEYFVISAEA